MVEGHMDDGLNFSRAQIEEDKSARVIRKCTSLISRFIKCVVDILIIFAHPLKFKKYDYIFNKRRNKLIKNMDFD